MECSRDSSRRRKWIACGVPFTPAPVPQAILDSRFLKVETSLKIAGCPPPSCLLYNIPKRPHRTEPCDVSGFKSRCHFIGCCLAETTLSA